MASSAMRRILILGSGGSGKTTLALQVSETTGHPVVHLDSLYWKAGWVATPRTPI
ncbi:MAG: isopentenyl transferase family protein [Gemmatimonadales bacterium]